MNLRNSITHMWNKRLFLRPANVVHIIFMTAVRTIDFDFFENDPICSNLETDVAEFNK